LVGFRRFEKKQPDAKGAKVAQKTQKIPREIKRKNAEPRR
jgi:hypothetical protein